VLAILALAAVLRQEPSKPVDESALYDALIKKTNELESFLAVYKATTSSGGAADSLRIAYRAPSDLRFEGMGLQMTARGGVFTVRMTTQDGKEAWARTPWEELNEKSAESLSRSIASEFETQRASWTGMDCGPMFQFAIPTIDGGKHDRFDISLNYVCPRGALLQWLEKFQRSPDVVASDERRPADQA